MACARRKQLQRPITLPLMNLNVYTFSPPADVLPWAATCHCAVGLWMHTYFATSKGGLGALQDTAAGSKNAVISAVARRCGLNQQAQARLVLRWLIAHAVWHMGPDISALQRSVRGSHAHQAARKEDITKRQLDHHSPIASSPCPQWCVGPHHTGQRAAIAVPIAGTPPCAGRHQVGVVECSSAPLEATVPWTAAAGSCCSSWRSQPVLGPLLTAATQPQSARRTLPHPAHSGVVFGIVARVCEALCGCKLAGCARPAPATGGASGAGVGDVTFEAALAGTAGVKLSGTPTYRMPKHPQYRDFFSNPMWVWAQGRSCGRTAGLLRRCACARACSHVTT